MYLKVNIPVNVYLFIGCTPRVQEKSTLYRDMTTNVTKTKGNTDLSGAHALPQKDLIRGAFLVSYLCERRSRKGGAQRAWAAGWGPGG